ncbi:PleD family two-component response regulator [Pedobacter sp. W3I1]|uniref:response regulator n=1 Tax=Pedobacter sp. W3I1 TaxID=3042291 RepID=UPI00278A642C|nr:response regulator [Pedobacter sp. W3I1]MDQ0637834.1 PleD family two-component response regulator [Pedobacter sp. W3I1]
MEQKMHNRPVECLKSFPQRLMIIEDDLALSEVLDNLFTDLGYHCRMETDAPEINTIEGFRPDLVIIDYHLPKVNGGEICAALKNNKLLAKTPVIIISQPIAVYYFTWKDMLLIVLLRNPLVFRRYYGLLSDYCSERTW